jgi:hypothetical protein
MNKIELTETHKRLISSLFFILEQKTENIEHILRQTPENASYFVKQDISEDDKKRTLETCAQLKRAIDKSSSELSLKKRRISQAQYINTIQSHMWEHISDAFSYRMTGYGDRVASKAKVVDPFIKKISEIIDRLQL